MAMNIDDIKYFIKTAELLNVTRASEVLGVSQPALSYSLKRLEGQLGAPLFIRLKNGMRLTKLGEEFLKKSHTLIFDWKELEKLVDPDSEEVIGEYSIAIHPSVAQFCLKSFLPKILKEFPKINIRFFHGLSREMTEKVISWEADFGIVVNPIAHPDLTIVELYKDEVTGFGLKVHAQKLIMDQELHQTQFILKKINPKKWGSISSNNLDVVFELASLGLGVGILPESIARKNNKLMKIKDFPKFEDRICLVYRHEKMNTIIAKRILDIVKKNMGDK
jgi:DNA-binding transcriptional LysR family regulator